MKIQSVRLVIAAALTAVPNLLLAQPSAHYTPGLEGIKGASLPPPGFYMKDYNLFYDATRLNDASGNDTHTPGFEAFTYANVPRAIWITDTKFLGGFVGVDALVPILYQSLEVPGYDHSTFGLGDVFAESTLSWHIKQFDFAVASGIHAPTGDFSAHSTRAGLGYWTFMQTAGAT